MIKYNIRKSTKSSKKVLTFCRNNWFTRATTIWEVEEIKKTKLQWQI